MNLVDEHFVGRAAVVRQIYDEILRVSKGFGAFAYKLAA